MSVTSDILDESHETIDTFLVYDRFFHYLLKENGFLDKGISRYELEQIMEDKIKIDVSKMSYYLDLVFETQDYITSDDFHAFTQKVMVYEIKNKMNDFIQMHQAAE